MRRLTGMALLVTGFAFALSGCARSSFFKTPEETPAPPKEAKVGSLAPDLEGIDFEGRPFRLRDYRGKVVAVSFWRVGCIPCLAMIPHEQALVQRYRGKNFAFLGVNLDEDRDTAAKVMQARGVSWRNYQGGIDESVATRWSIKGLPTIYVIDAKGIIRYARNDGAELEQTIEALLAESTRRR
jgi:thiol-disulfide isomerase/thioredoxin